MDNVYKAPEAELVQRPTSEFGSPFFVTSITKFVLLYLLTFGVYLLYWGYKQWDSQRAGLGKTIWPVWRAIAQMFYTHSLSRLISERLRQQQQADWHYRVAANWYVVMCVIGLPSIFYNEVLISPAVDFTAFLVLLVGSMLPVLAIQRRANLASLDPQGESNSSLGAANWVFMVIGAGLWVLTILGYVMMALGLAPQS